MLWAKAEASGFTSEELAALREEFTHHQDKIDQYYDILANMETGDQEAYKSKIFYFHLQYIFFNIMLYFAYSRMGRESNVKTLH